MAHDVTFELPTRPLGKGDAIFMIKKNGKTLGKLRISLGGIDWLPKHAKNPIKMDWNEFALILEKDKWTRSKQKSLQAPQDAP